MSNDYFRFKQFTVWQNRSAMKVCTDACLFGAWAAGFATKASRVLDIGAGTGLLSLMIAQESSARINAIEIDEDAASQARDNFNASVWKDRLTIVRQSIQDYAACSNVRYDLIISNPPFYKNDLKSPDGKRNLALHGSELSLKKLFTTARKLLAPGGSFGVLVAAHRALEAEGIADANTLYLKEKVNVRQTPHHPFFRTMYLFCSASCSGPGSSEVIIKKDQYQYTREFTELLKDYYLIFDNVSL